MVRPIVRDPVFLAQKSLPAGPEDLELARDLRDTLEAHREECVGMAANMIGVLLRVIVFDGGAGAEVMFNPEIVKCSGPYKTEEGCLSLEGVRPTRRWRSVKIRYQNENMQTRIRTYEGWTAQIIQHELDHCSGILI